MTPANARRDKPPIPGPAHRCNARGLPFHTLTEPEVSNSHPIRLFGADRSRVGWEEHEWSVWILGMDDIHPQTSLEAALQFAAEHNAAFAELRLRDGDHAIPLYAVVLHHGYAWTQATEHAHGVACGVQECGSCPMPQKAAS